MNSGCGLTFGPHLLLKAKHYAEAPLKANHIPYQNVTMRNLDAILGIVAIYIGRTMFMRKH